ncbi:MAG: hypothetical protein U5K56_10230 [Halioglobus sp.]|nr:hypothetical protein [Halioglobus sp.]
MKTTLELPDDLMRKLRIRAAESDRRLKDVVTELLERGLEASNDKQDTDPLRAWLSKLELRARDRGQCGWNRRTRFRVDAGSRSRGESSAAPAPRPASRATSDPESVQHTALAVEFRA